MKTFPIKITTSILLALLCGCAHQSQDLADGTGPYQYPMASPGAKFGALPPAAQNTIRAQVGAAVISDIETQYGPEGPVYTILFRNTEVYPPLIVAADGSLLRPDLSVAVGASRDTFNVVSSGPVTGVKPTELPALALKSIQDRAPGAHLASINKETWGNQNVFIITFTDPEHHPRLYVTGDGKVLNGGPR
jgi:hypothetical protein